MEAQRRANEKTAALFGKNLHFSTLSGQGYLMPKLSDLKALDDAKADRKALLTDLQCNILSSHLRANTHYFFLTFQDREQARLVLRGLAHGDDLGTGLKLQSELSSRGRQVERSKQAPAMRYQGSPGFSTSLMLAARCYTQFLPELALPPDAAFQHGMPGRDDTLEGADRLNDPERLERGPRIHAVYTVSYDLHEPWQPVREKILSWLTDLRVTVREDEGYVLRHPTKNHAIEPFGYRDAISQPLFFEEDMKTRIKHEGAAATVAGGQWSSFAPLSLVLVPDPNGKSEDAHGTYVAYRKLRQNVDLFYRQAERLADEASKRPNAPRLSRDQVADRLIGRTLDGTPLDGGPNQNDFTYPNDSVCPMHAHVRKVNPRDPYARPHRIVRRATVFGPRLKRGPEGRPTLPPQSEDGGKSTDVGLLFFCCQADIKQQFEFIQAQWANDMTGGADTVIAQLPPNAEHKIALNGSGLTLSYSPVVEVLEGEYFFVPSISFFSSL